MIHRALPLPLPPVSMRITLTRKRAGFPFLIGVDGVGVLAVPNLQFMHKPSRRRYSNPRHSNFARRDRLSFLSLSYGG